MSATFYLSLVWIFETHIKKQENKQTNKQKHLLKIIY